VYATTVPLRFLLAWQTFDSPLHTLDGEFLSILTHDAALYGYYASLFLEGLPHTKDVHMIEYIIYYLVKLTPFTLDQVMYYAPAFLSSLIVIPTMLIASLYIHHKTIVILVGLVSGIGYGFYSRSYLGYFDTDVLNIFFPMFILYGMLATIKKSNLLYLVIVLVSAILYLLWYQSSKPLTYAMLGLFMFYMTLSCAYKYKSFAIKYKYYSLLTLAVSIILLFYFIDPTIYIRHSNRYLFKESILHISNFNFVAPMQHLSEAKGTNTYFIAGLISGNIYIFVLSLIGYVVLVYRYKEMILALPMIALGLLSITTGVRFHIYAVCIFIISYFFLFYGILKYFKIEKYIAIFIIVLIAIPAFYENYKILNEWNKRATPVFNPEQVSALKKLDKVKKPNDYVVTWWDYGYAVQYYAGLKTMINNGKNRADNYTVANILLSDSQKFTHHSIHYFYNLFDKYKRNAIVRALIKHKNPQRLFEYISNVYKDTKNKTDKYLILPSQMAELAYTIYMFANIDPITGDKTSNHIFKMFTILGQDNQFIYLSDHAKIEKKASILHTHNKKLAIKTVASVKYNKGSKDVQENTLAHKGLNLIVDANKYYIMDDYFYNSSLVQMMFFNHYDKKYFEPTYVGESISIYKVK